MLVVGSVLLAGCPRNTPAPAQHADTGSGATPAPETSAAATGEASAVGTHLPPQPSTALAWSSGDARALDKERLRPPSKPWFADVPRVDAALPTREAFRLQEGYRVVTDASGASWITHWVFGVFASDDPAQDILRMTEAVGALGIVPRADPPPAVDLLEHPPHRVEPPTDHVPPPPLFVWGSLGDAVFHVIADEVAAGGYVQVYAALGRQDPSGRARIGSFAALLPGKQPPKIPMGEPSTELWMARYTREQGRAPVGQWAYRPVLRALDGGVEGGADSAATRPNDAESRYRDWEQSIRRWLEQEGFRGAGGYTLRRDGMQARLLGGLEFTQRAD